VTILAQTGSPADRAQSALPPYVGPLKDDPRQGIVRRMIQDAVQYVDESLSPQRVEATKYYKGEKFGTEMRGRSQYVSTDLRDTVNGIMPSLLRIFFGNGSRVVEIRPRNSTNEDLAKQQTDYLNLVICEDNPGFTEIQGGIKDAGVRKIGVFKWWWDNAIEKRVQSYTGVDSDQATMLLTDPNCTARVLKVTGDEQTGLAYDMLVTFTRSEGLAKFRAMPPEEFILSRGARSIDEAIFVGHRQELPIYKLIAMGYERSMCEHYAAMDAKLHDHPERLARRGDTSYGDEDELIRDPLTRVVPYCEGYCELEVWVQGADGTFTGTGEVLLHKVCTMGNAREIVAIEPCPEKPFTVICFDPEPHTIVGQGLDDYTKDIQFTKSHIMRKVLDSLNLSLDPRVEAVEGQVNLQDLLNPQIGGVVRVRQPGMMRELTHTFVGAEALPVLQGFDDIKESRTGQSKGAMGLDADALQSTTKIAAAGILTASQQRIELFARNIAEGLKALYKGLYRLQVRHQNKPRTVKLRGSWVTVDPRTWDMDCDVVVNVGLGSGTLADRIGYLKEVAMDQQTTLQTMGLVNPLVSLGQLRHTKARIVELLGEPDAAQFYKPVNDQEVEQMASQPPKPTGEELLAQTQMQAIQADMVNKQAEVQQKRQAMLLQDDRERDKLDAEILLEAAKIEAQYHMTIDTATIQAKVRAQRPSPA